MGNYASVDSDPSLMPLWANIVGKPATFTPTSHGDSAHSETYVKATGTPLNNQIGIWTAANTLEGDAKLTWDGTVMSVSGNTRLVGVGSSVLFDTTGSASANSIATSNDYWLTLFCGRGTTAKLDLKNNGDILATGNLKSTGEITAYA